ncbi:hypothetical protein HQ571_06525 [Candidatus Kuenenbacteria bacterium]|nr:hypothetical protein [Candidatus Kuenenbacteria bacterium]
MNKKTSKKEIQQRAKEIEATYAEYLAKLNELKKKQTTIINQFMKELEQKKIDEIRKTLNE